MYDVDERDVVIAEENIPDSDAGAPMPVVVADDLGATVAYYSSSDVGRRARREDLAEEKVVVLRFAAVHALMFGAPNDEALRGHPLGDRGLEPYRAFRVDDSSWLRRLEQMNRVHDEHSVDVFSRLRHFIMTFHDTTFECASAAEPDVAIRAGTSPQQAVLETLRRND